MATYVLKMSVFRLAAKPTNRGLSRFYSTWLTNAGASVTTGDGSPRTRTRRFPDRVREKTWTLSCRAYNSKVNPSLHFCCFIRILKTSLS